MEVYNGSVPWPRPLCLVENIDGSGSAMTLNADTVEKLKQITEPVVVVSVVGLYRTGKSYLMNLLAKKQCGFDLGNTVQAKTKGIWIWCVAHFTRRDYRLILMDTEGLEDVEKGDTTNDTMIFLLAALLSSTLIYNSKGTIDQTAINKLQFVTQLAEKIRIAKSSESTDDDDRELCAFFPTFVWAVRDFCLRLEIDGNVVTADEYLENGLKTKPGCSRAVTNYNLPRQCIKSYFPTRKCFVFPFPTADPELMSMLGGQMDSTLPADGQEPKGLADNQLVHAFLLRSKEFCDYIYGESQPKRIFGVVMDGIMFANQAKYYIDAIASGSIPCIEDSFTATAEAVNHTALERCVAHYMNAMSSIELPTVDEDTLREHDMRCTEQVKTIFRRQIIVVNNGDRLHEKLSSAIADKYKEVSERNETASAKKCRMIMEIQFELIKDKIRKGLYHCKGGYSAYLTDFDAAFDVYKDTPDKGVQASAIEQEYVTKYSDTAKCIIAVDSKLTEKEKQEEEQRVTVKAVQLQLEELRRRDSVYEQLLVDQERRLDELKRALIEKLNEQTCLHEEQIKQLTETLSSREVDLSTVDFFRSVARIYAHVTRDISEFRIRIQSVMVPT